MKDESDLNGPDNIKRLQARLANARKIGGRPLESSDIKKLCEAGQEDFSGVRFWGNRSLRDVKIRNLSGAVLNGARFIACDLRDASFAGVDLQRAKFFGSDVTGADFSSSNIGGESIDFNSNKKSIPETSLLRLTTEMWESVTACDDAEPRFASLFFDGKFNHEGNHFGEGVVLKSGDVVLGVLKQYQEDSFLATRTVTDMHGKVILWKGGIYQIHHPQLKQLEIMLAQKNKAASSTTGGVWPVVDIDNFSEVASQKLSPDSRDFGAPPTFKLNFVRFLNDPKLYSRLEEWTKTLEASTNVVVFP